MALRLWNQGRYMSKLLPMPPCKNEANLGKRVIDAIRRKATDKTLVGKHVAYIGGYGSIGFACCKQIMASGAKHLVVMDVKQNCLKNRVLHCVDPKVLLNFVKLDVTDGIDGIEEALEETVKHMGHIDILINGANFLDDRDPVQTMDVNLIGLVETTLAAIPIMSHTQGGKGGLIVNIASVWGLEPSGSIAIYSACKHGIIGFTRSLAHDLYFTQTGIRHMAICPGPTAKDQPFDLVGRDTFHISKPLSEKLMSLKHQSADQCASKILKAIKSYENGSVWIAAEGKLQKAKMATYWNSPFRKH